MNFSGAGLLIADLGADGPYVTQAENFLHDRCAECHHQLQAPDPHRRIINGEVICGECAHNSGHRPLRIRS